MAAIVDLRSDTVTKPCAGMRKAMASAEVGDDVYGEDPSVTALQERVAAETGKEAALFVASGTMGNQIGINIHTQPGDGVIAGAKAHVAFHEAGAAGFLSGVQVTLVNGDGRFTGNDVVENYRADDLHGPPTSLVTVENTHNGGGGLLWNKAQLDDVLQATQKLKLRTHLDGARIWNAAAATKRSVADLCTGFDTVSVCLSKGLGAPVGSVLAGSRALIHRALRVRKRLGGGMRQAGIIAAGGLYALQNNQERLSEDHENARFLASELASISDLTLINESVETNILLVSTGQHNAENLRKQATERGLLFWTAGTRALRLVTHLDIDRNACARAVEILASLLR